MINFVPGWAKIIELSSALSWLTPGRRLRSSVREHQKEVPPPVEPGKSLKNPADWGVMEIYYFSMPRSRSWHIARKIISR
jgi:hypothetical protein